jgi:hypothetical protein
MDDATKAAFGEVGDRLDRVETKAGSVERRVEQVHALVQQRAEDAGEERRRFHGEQMRAFQGVVEEIRADRDRRLSGIEAAVAELRGQVAALQAALSKRQ